MYDGFGMVSEMPVRGAHMSGRYCLCASGSFSHVLVPAPKLIKSRFFLSRLAVQIKSQGSEGSAGYTNRQKKNFCVFLK